MARRARAPRRTGLIPPGLPGRHAGDARSVRRGSQDPRGDRAELARAAGGSSSRTSPRSSPSGSSSGPAIRRRRGARRRGLQNAHGTGNEGSRSHAAGNLAGALRARPARRGRGLGGRADGAAQGTTLWNGCRRRVKAKALARRGAHADAERLAREAVTIGEETDMLDSRATRTPTSRRYSYSPGSRSEAVSALGQALGRYGRKGNLVSADACVHGSGRWRRPLLRLRRAG